MLRRVPDRSTYCGKCYAGYLTALLTATSKYCVLTDRGKFYRSTYCDKCYAGCLAAVLTVAGKCCVLTFAVLTAINLTAENVTQGAERKFLLRLILLR